MNEFDDRRRDDGPALDEETRLDQELEATDQVLREHLARLLSPPDDLATRTTREVAATLLRRSTIASAVDLLTVGWHATRTLFGTDETEVRR